MEFISTQNYSIYGNIIHKNQETSKNFFNIKFFENYSGKTIETELRHTHKKITYRGAKFKVKSRNKKLHVIALKYENESKYRYLIANDTTWFDIDVIKAYAFRWLVEIFIQD
ncbi:IS4 family transposase domain protein [Rickettsiales endosymbiont of Paramecium tredecaurelia]|uniref:hypothetical protein n=1 Tax=Candidatus Sarmatiella mevalonica TaxID=2770581 RepID=UPI00192188AD|nr:hypothetical protein [Candidatus Sarmatiella mevalonica]MBL3285130.1 IS4 family transposase domain protein [Candidatus Sarmatiella mevalonica]